MVEVCIAVQATSFARWVLEGDPWGKWWGRPDNGLPLGHNDLPGRAVVGSGKGPWDHEA